MGVRTWQMGLLASVGLLLMVSAPRAGENNSPPDTRLPPPPLWVNDAKCAAQHSIPTPPAATVPVPVAPGLNSDETLVRELIAILGETQSHDAFLVTLSILHELKADPRLAVPAIIRNAERLQLFACTAPDQATEKQKMVAGCIAGLIKKDSVPGPLPVPATTAVPGTATGEVPCVAPTAGATKPTDSEIVPGNAKSRRTRKW